MKWEVVGRSLTGWSGPEMGRAYSRQARSLPPRMSFATPPQRFHPEKKTMDALYKLHLLHLLPLNLANPATLATRCNSLINTAYTRVYVIICQ